ncbi:MAG TPA: hypothetical protein P5534_15570 [Candidatus Paceibacterota bacterium]|mgnify:CR=1 FL=1|nr:hypothetical protein [Candidatus Paceibacterota bacterium]HRZ57337.1 hypothetical protein [Candidatus Paceibacterota bacterium]
MSSLAYHVRLAFERGHAHERGETSRDASAVIRRNIAAMREGQALRGIPEDKRVKWPRETGRK